MTNEQIETVFDDSNHLPPVDEPRYAGFWMRFWAYIADLIIVFSITGLLIAPLNLLNNGEIISVGYWTLRGLAGGIIFYLYFLIMTKKLGQTLGKMIFGLQVVRADRSTLGWSDLIFREVIGRFIYKAFFLLNFLYLVVAFNKEKKGIHDIFADTRVIHTT